MNIEFNVEVAPWNLAEALEVPRELILSLNGFWHSFFLDTVNSLRSYVLINIQIYQSSVECTDLDRSWVEGIYERDGVGVNKVVSTPCELAGRLYLSCQFYNKVASGMSIFFVTPTPIGQNSWGWITWLNLHLLLLVYLCVRSSIHSNLCSAELNILDWSTVKFGDGAFNCNFHIAWWLLLWHLFSIVRIRKKTSE
jgi:hypothetical protein